VRRLLGSEGLHANLRGTAALLEALRRQKRPARLVFASTIAVYGVPMPALIDESTLPAPTLSYGAQKLAGEILVTDYSRRGFIDGCSLRLPGIVARPSSSGMLSAFLSDIIRVLSAGGSFTCPVSEHGMSWWMSRRRVVDNLLHAAALGAPALSAQRVFLLPVLHASLGEVVAAIARVHGPEVCSRVTYHPNAALQAQFASYPPLSCPRSLAAGFRHDGSLDALVRDALEEP
jgi:nucleoside-diphosphate-sugar epimerase